MKTMTLKDVFKLFVFLLILCSAKAFSNPKLPIGGSGDCETRLGSSTPSKRSAMTPTSSATTSKVKLKASVSK